MGAPYDNPIALCSGVTGTGVQSAVLDIGSTTVVPPTLDIQVTSGVVKIEGSLFSDSNFRDLTNGGLSISDFWTPGHGPRFLRVNIVSNSGSVSVFAGNGISVDGAPILPNLITVTNTNASL